MSGTENYLHELAIGADIRAMAANIARAQAQARVNELEGQNKELRRDCEGMAQSLAQVRDDMAAALKDAAQEAAHYRNAARLQYERANRNNDERVQVEEQLVRWQRLAQDLAEVLGRNSDIQSLQRTADYLAIKAR